MITKIPITSRDALTKVCLLAGYRCEFFTDEENDQLIKVMVTDNRQGLTESQAFWLGAGYRQEKTDRILKELE